MESQIISDEGRCVVRLRNWLHSNQTNSITFNNLKAKDFFLCMVSEDREQENLLEIKIDHCFEFSNQRGN